MFQHSLGTINQSGTQILARTFIDTRFGDNINWFEENFVEIIKTERNNTKYVDCCAATRPDGLEADIRDPHLGF